MNPKKIKLYIGLIGGNIQDKVKIINALCENYQKKDKFWIIKIKIIYNQIETNLKLKFFNIEEENMENFFIQNILKCSGILYIFSILNKKSFEECENKLNEIKKSVIYQNSRIILLVNKNDLNKTIEVSENESENLAKNKGYKLFKCNFENNKVIIESVYYLIDTILSHPSKKITISILGDKLVGKSYI